MEVLRRRYGGTKVRKWSVLRYWWWNLRAELKHVLGLHTYISVERWDVEQDSIQFAGNRCWVCDVEG